MSIRLTLNLNQLYALNIRAFCINISTTDFISDKKDIQKISKIDYSY